MILKYVIPQYIGNYEIFDPSLFHDAVNFVTSPRAVCPQYGNLTHEEFDRFISEFGPENILFASRRSSQRNKKTAGHIQCILGEYDGAAKAKLNYVIGFDGKGPYSLKKYSKDNVVVDHIIHYPNGFEKTTRWANPQLAVRPDRIFAEGLAGKIQKYASKISQDANGCEVKGLKPVFAGYLYKLAKYIR